MESSSSSEFSYYTPRAFTHPDLEFVRYGETRRVSDTMLRGNVSSTPAVINQENYKATRSPLPYEEWALQESTNAEIRVDKLRQLLGLARLALLRVSHGTDSIDASIHMPTLQSSIPYSQRPFADSGFVTRSGDGLMIAPADCVVANVAWPHERVVAQVHSGIRGFAQEAIPKAFHRFSEIGLRSSDAIVYLSPYAHHFRANEIEQRDMETMVAANSSEVVKEYHLLTSKPASFKGDMYVDQEGFAHAQLIRSGVRPTHITQSVQNTVSDSDLYSEYKARTTGAPNGRFGVAIGLAPDTKR